MNSAHTVNREVQFTDAAGIRAGNGSADADGTESSNCRLIVTCLSNGLGNQLFQYAAGRFLARKFGASLKTAHDGSEEEATGAHRPMMLDKFAIASGVELPTRRDRLILSRRPRFALPSWVARRSSHAQVIRDKPDQVVRYRPFPVEAWARTVYLTGYWQVHQIADAVRGELLSEFSLRGPLGEISRGYAADITSSRTPVSIHLRRGDYLTSKKHKVLPASYYERSVTMMKNWFPDVRFYVFSDDPAFAHEWVAERPGFVVVDHNDDSTAHEDLYLMSLCHHHVMANSTFSWWGAWLNLRTEKRVIAPADWHGTRTAETDVAPPEWQLV